MPLKTRPFMQISIETRLDYAVPEPVDVLLQIEAAMIPEQTVLQAHIDLPPAEHFARVPGQSGIGDRIWLRMTEPLVVHYRATVEINRLLADTGTLAQTPPHQLPGDTVDYLMASRYCQADTFQDFAHSEFGGTSGGARITAIRDWIAPTLRYEPGLSPALKTAADTSHSRMGVCSSEEHTSELQSLMRISYAVFFLQK